MKTMTERLLSLIIGFAVFQAPAAGNGAFVNELQGSQSDGTAKSFSKPARSKVGGDLSALHAEYQAYLSQAGGQGQSPSAFKSRNKLARVVGGMIIIDAVASGDPKALAADLRKLGAQKVTVFKRMVSARLPLSAIPALNELSTLQFARPAYAGRNSGAASSQGDAAMNADNARTLFGVDGAGVTVGTLSDSYNCLGGAAAGVASGDLPSGVTVLEEGPCAGGIDEGRAMMEIIHDVAPGAVQSFHTAANGQADFAQGIKDLANAGAKVINDDYSYYLEPFYQDGNIAQAVDTVKGMGVAYFSSAGNAGRRAYESAFRPSGVFVDLGYGPGELHDFDPGAGVDVCQQITIPAFETLTMVLQWDQPFLSVSGAPGSASDLDIILTDATCATSNDHFITGGGDFNVGLDPVEFFSYTNFCWDFFCVDTTFGIMISHYIEQPTPGPHPGRMKMVNFGSSFITFDEFDTKSATSGGHSAALGGLGVGAADYQSTPAFGVNPPQIESFSSAGGTPILFDTSGNRLGVPQIRQQPGITAPDGVDTTFFGSSDSDISGFPNFFGTSAAAPHAAGVAALMRDLNPSLTPEAIYSALKAMAVDMDDPSTAGFDTGFDYGTGFGLIQADCALTTASAAPFTFDPALPVKGQVGLPYNYNLPAAKCGTPPYTYSVTGLPDGVTFTAPSNISGTPTVAGTFEVTATATDSALPAPVSVSKKFSVIIAESLSFVPALPLTGQISVAYNYTLPAATGGTPPYTYSVTGLPPGVSFIAPNTITGTPTIEGTFNVTITATDSFSPVPASVSTNFTVKIYPVSDFAVTKIKAPKSVKGAAPVAKKVSVSIQNRSPHNETIAVSDLGDGITTGLVRLNINVADDDGEDCAAAVIALDSAHTLKSTKVLKPKQTITVKYDVTYTCLGALPKNKEDNTPGDYSYIATVHHEVLDGPDIHSADDICPRNVLPPYELDPNPDGKVKDIGCGTKKVDKTFGNPVITNVIGN